MHLWKAFKVYRDRPGQAGIDYLIVEKHDEVGGTWYANPHPGTGADSANSFYSYSFAG
jgi:4-hydroxyacetophenone monooxygenase